MRATVSYVMCTDEVVELRIAYGGREVLSHINYSHLERVKRSRASLQGSQHHATRVEGFKSSSPTATLWRAPNFFALPVDAHAGGSSLLAMTARVLRGSLPDARLDELKLEYATLAQEMASPELMPARRERAPEDER